MTKHLQILLVTAALSTPLLSLLVCAEDSSNAPASITATTIDGGRKIYVNDETVTLTARHAAAPVAHGGLAYWSNTEHRWKPVALAHMRAARSAAAEVDRYLGNDNGEASAAAPTNSFSLRGKVFSQEDIDQAIDQAAARHNVDANLVRSVIKVESNFNPNAVSRKGAMGLMQLMPQTARQLNVVNPFDPAQNVDAGVRHLKKLMENYGGDVKLTLAAYNAGAGAVARSAGIPNFSETRNYVRRITQLYYGGSSNGEGLVTGTHVLGNVVRNPVRVERDARGVLYISNTD